MYIKKVELENIKKFKKVCVEFTSGLNFISGENGAGKTTIIESIGYALFNAPVSNKGFLPYIIRKGEKSGRIRVTFLDKDNNELISDRKVSQTSSGCSWSIRRIVDGEEDVVVSGNSEVCAYLKDHLEFYPDDDMSQVYEKILSVPQGAMTAGFFLTDTQRKSEFDPLFKLDSYRKAFDRIKLIKSLNEENIKLDNEIAEMNGKISSLDTLKEDKEKNDKLLKEKEETYKDFVVSEKKVKEDFEKIDKVKSDIEKKQNDLKLKNLELDKFKTVKEKYEKDLEDINKSVDVLKENEKEYKEYLDFEKQLEGFDKDIEVFKKSKEEYDTKKARIEKGKATIEAQTNIVNTSKSQIEKLNEKIAKSNKDIDELQKKYNELKKDTNDDSNNDKLLEEARKANSKIIEYDAMIKTLEKELTNSLLNNDAKEILYLNSASKNLKEIISESDGHIKDLATSANESLNRAIEINKNSNNANTNADSIAEKEKLEQELDSLVRRFIKDEKLIDEYENDRSNAKEIFADYLTSLEKSSKGPNEETIKCEVELKTLNENLKELNKELEEVKTSFDNDSKKLTVYIDAVKGFENEVKSLEDDVKKYEELDKNINEIKKNMSLIKDKYQSYVLNMKKKDDFDKTKKALDDTILNYKKCEEEIKTINDELELVIKDFDLDNYNKLKEEVDKYKVGSKVFETEIDNIKKDIDRINKTIDEFKEIKKLIKDKTKEKDENDQVIEVVKKLRTVINEAPEVIANMLIKDISEKANEFYSEMAPGSNRLEWENSYELSLYDYFDDSEIKKEFKQLSGGEQMSAALAIRIAMIQKLTELKIGILDEPTINMDVYRRTKLGEIIDGISDEFNQLFVVSHDDTFENITQNVIPIVGGE